MARITGIGGIFFRTKNPEKLSKWYQENLGIMSDASGTPWQQEAGLTVFAPFPADSDYFPVRQPFMLNLRVDDLDALLSELSEKGVKIDEQRMSESYGKFAWIYDPEGNKIELWQPLP